MDTETTEYDEAFADLGEAAAVADAWTGRNEDMKIVVARIDAATPILKRLKADRDALLEEAEDYLRRQDEEASMRESAGRTVVRVDSTALRAAIEQAKA